MYQLGYNEGHMRQPIAAIIPTMYTGRPHALVRAIRSVQQTRVRNISFVVVVNNAPKDSSEYAMALDISTRAGVPVTVLTSYINRGFAPAVNDGILFAQARYHPDWYLILNDDARLHANFFRALPLQSFDAVSCKMLSTSGAIESSGLRYFSTGLAFPRRADIRKEDIPFFTGACVMLSRSRVEKELTKHGYVFNPLFFAYAEDLELSLRILRDGGTIFISNKGLVTHEGSNTAKRGSFFQLYYGYRNLLLIIFLLWSRNDIVLRLPWLGIGQLYIIAMSVYKDYWLLYPKIWW